MALLEVRDLAVEFPNRHHTVKTLRGISFDLHSGERLGIVGESGAGKSMTAFAILNLISEPGYISSGSIMFEGKDLTKLDGNALRHIRGGRISMIFQDPMVTLNPVLTIGDQMVETLRAHTNVTYEEAKQSAITRLAEVSIPSPEQRFYAYPHELSGGMRQRVVIAIALLTEPSLIIADEPTTALDVTIQAEILTLLLELCTNHNMGLILISHDLAVVSQITQKVIVMYAGQIVETGNTQAVCGNPRHPYTQGLIASLPERNPNNKFLNQIPGTMPSPETVPDVGCAFSDRCVYVQPKCREETPVLQEYDNIRAGCFYVEQISEGRKI